MIVGFRAKRDVHPHAECYAVVELVCAVNMGRGGGFSDFAVGCALHAAALVVAGLGIVIFERGGNDVDCASDFGFAVQMG